MGGAQETTLQSSEAEGVPHLGGGISEVPERDCHRQDPQLSCHPGKQDGGESL